MYHRISGGFLANLKQKRWIAVAKEETVEEQSIFKENQRKCLEIKVALEDEFHKKISIDALADYIDRSSYLLTVEKEEAQRSIEYAKHSYRQLYDALVNSLTRQGLKTPLLSSDPHHLADDDGSEIVRRIIDEASKNNYLEVVCKVTSSSGKRLVG